MLTTRLLQALLAGGALLLLTAAARDAHRRGMARVRRHTHGGR